MSLFRQASTKNAIEAIALLMDRAFFVAPSIPETEVITEYEQVRASWRSKELFKGSPSRVKGLVLRNLEEYERNDHFQDFHIDVYQDQKCAQVSAIFRDPACFVGVRVWRTSGAAFACGNAAFRSEAALNDLSSAISQLEAECARVPDDEPATMRLFQVLTKLQFRTAVDETWTPSLRQIIACGEDAVPWLTTQLDRLTPRLGVPQPKLDSNILQNIQRWWNEQELARLLYCAVALCYIRSPRTVQPLCTLLEANAQAWIWPRSMGQRVMFMDSIERVYTAISRALYWNKATSVLPRLRGILDTAHRAPERVLNALPYTIRAIGFLGSALDAEIVEPFQRFSCPQFDVSERYVRTEAKHALYVLRHPDERESRANSPLDDWRM